MFFQDATKKTILDRDIHQQEELAGGWNKATNLHKAARMKNADQ